MGYFLEQVIKLIGKFKFVRYILLLIIGYSFYYLQPFLLSKIIGSNGKMSISLSLLFFLTLIIPSLLNYVGNFYLQSVRNYSKWELWTNLDAGGYEYFNNDKIGKIQNYVNEVSFACRKIVQESLPAGIKVVVLLTMYSLMLSINSRLDGFLYLAIFIIYMIISIKLSGSNRKNIKKALNSSAKVNEYFLDFFNNKDSIYSNRSINHEHEILNQKLNDEENTYFNVQKKTNSTSLLQQSFIIVISFLVIIYALLYQHSEANKVSTILIFMYSILNLIQFGAQFLELIELKDRIKSGLKALKYPIHHLQPDQRILNPQLSKIMVKNLKYHYPNNKALFDNLSISFNLHSSTALIGQNGAGKSTLLKIIGGLITPQDGEIYLPVNNYQSVVYVGQSTPLFNRSIYENITYPESNVSWELIKKLIIEINLAPKFQNEAFIKSTKLTELKNGLSGGEQQKILILRTIIQKPQIILFDETTSALDPLATKTFYTLIDRYLKESTLIAIVHKESELKYFNEVRDLTAPILNNGTDKSIRFMA